MMDPLEPVEPSEEALIEYGPPRTFGRVVEALYATIDQRAIDLPEGSYTVRLLTGHEDALLKKIGEEATEFVLAAKENAPERVRYEAADLIYHMLVVLRRYGVRPDDVAEELAARFK